VSATAGPTPAHERSGLVDVLRALALLGILAVNLEFLASSVDEGWARPEYGGALDRAARAAVVALLQLKSYLVFALLFGYGAAAMLARSGDAAFRPRYLRRMAALAVLGVLHATLLFAGDILLSYALLGLLLLPARRASTPRLLRLAVVVYAGGAVLVLLLALLVATGEPTAAGDTAEVYAHGSFLDVAAHRLAEWPAILLVLAFVQWPGALAMFLVGMAMHRTGVLSRPEQARPLLRRLVRVALPVGLAGGAAAGALTLVAGDGQTGAAAGLGLLVQSLLAPALALGYVGLAGLAVGTRPWSRLVRALGPLGRMSLTAYLAESLVCSGLFNGYGLGWYGEVGPAGSLLVAVAVWSALAVVAAAWFRGFEHGPAEWLLRWATYARRPRLRRTRRDVTSVA
jgi:uncharacterized protein